MRSACRSYRSVLILTAGALACAAQSHSALPLGRFHLSGNPVLPLDAGVPKARRTEPLPPRFLNLPLYFEPGSAGTSLYRSQGLGYRMDFNNRGAVLQFGAEASGEPLALTFERPNRGVSIGGEDPLDSRSNYLVGSDPSLWRTDVANYGHLRYREVWPGVDLVFYGSQQTLEYDVQVAPGADLDKIRFRLDGAKKIAIEKDGSMTVETRNGVFRQRPPIVYQESNGARRSLSGRYVLLSRNRIGFKVDGFDKSRRLVIDPVIDYSTYLGGSQTDAAYGIAVDSTGAVYITGLTSSSGIAMSGAYQSTIAPGATNAFVVKLDPSGTHRIYSTYVGGSGSDIAWSIAVDSAGEAHIVGQTTSSNFPIVTQDSNDVSWTRAASSSGTRGFVAKVNANGNGLIYAYKIGGTGNNNINSSFVPEAAWQVALDSSGNAYVVGVTVSQDFQTRNAFQSFLSSPQNGFLAKLSPSGDRFYSSYVGLQDQFGDLGEVSGYAVTIDPSGNAYMAGVAAFTAQYSFVYYLQVNTNGQVGYINSVGGSAYQEPWRLAADANSNLYLCGYTTSTDFPVTPQAFQRSYGGGLWDAFVARFDQNGNTVFSTFLGGSGGDDAFSLRLNSAGNIVIAGRTNSHDFPIQPGAVQQTFAGGLFDGFIVTMAANGASLLNSTFLGGSNDDEIADVAVGPNGSLYVAGYTTSLNYPTTPGAFLNAIPGVFSSFVTKLDDPSVCNVSISSGEIDLSQNSSGGSVAVLAAPSSCNWAAVTDATWITLGQTSGTGSVSVPFTAAPNQTNTARSGTIKVNASSVKVFQFPQSCNFVIAPNSVLVNSSGGAQDIYLLTPLGSTCGWNASTDSPAWITILNPNGQGAGVLHLTIAPNTGTSPQTGNVTVGGQTLPIYQNPSTCVYSLSGSVFPFDTNGGSGVINVITSGPTCKWAASDPSDSWIQVIDKAGQGNGQVRFNVAPQGTLTNPASSLRISSSFVVAGQTFTVIQGYVYDDPRGGAGTTGSVSAPLVVRRPGAGHLPSSVHPLSSSICTFTGFSGGVTTLTFNPGDPPAQVTLNYTGTCAEIAPYLTDPSNWKASGTPPTFTITPPTSQPGNTISSTIHFLNLPIGAQADIPLSVTRNGNVCTVQPPQAPAIVPATGASTSVSVAVAPSSPACGISATATTSDGSNWLTFPNGSTQNPGTYVGQASGGAGQIPFTAASNTLPTQRTATMNVNGTSITVVQAGVTPACNVSIGSGAPITADNTAQTLPVPVTVSADSCAWNTSTSGTGISGTSNGTGNGDATVTLTANTGSGSRTGTVTVNTTGSNSASVTIVQNGVPVVSCNYSVSPASAPSIIPAAGGGGSFTVSTTSGCSWTPTDPDSWVIVAPASTQSGSGQVTYTVTANTGGQRSSTITIASGVVFSLTQAQGGNPGVTFTLTPNPIQVCDGSGLGQGTVTWNVPGATSIAVRFADGTTWVTGGASGSSQSGKWVSNGLQFLLFDTSSSSTGVQVGSITASLTTTGCPPPPSGSFTLTPNPIQVCDGSGLGQGTIAWNVPGATSVAIRFGNGTAWITGGASGSSQTGKWVSNGLQFLLFDTSNSTAGVQVGLITASLTTTGCPPPPSLTFTLTPNPIQVCDGSGLGQATVAWSIPGAASVAIRFGNGSPWITGGASGSSQTGKWVSDGLQFLLFDTSNSAAGIQVGSITAALTTMGCSQPPPTCTYSVSPTSASVSAAASTGTFTVNAPSGCPWAVSWAVSWLSATPLTGSGTQAVTYTVAANTGPARSGSITTLATAGATADVVFSLTQAVAAGNVGGAPPAQLINNNGGDWAYRASLGSSNVNFTGAQVASDTLAIISTTGDSGYFLYPSSTSAVQVLWDIRNYQTLNLSIAAILSSTQGIQIAPGTPSVILTSANGQMTITPVTSSQPAATIFYNYQVPFNGAPGWVAVPTGSFNPAAVTSVQVGFRVLNQGFIFYLADVSFAP